VPSAAELTMPPVVAFSATPPPPPPERSFSPPNTISVALSTVQPDVQLHVEVSPAVVTASASRFGMIAPPPGAISLPNLAPTPSIPAPVSAPLPADALDDRTTVAAPRRLRGTWRLTLPDGSSHPLTGTTVLGRQPEVSAAAGASQTLEIHDPDGLVSKSHAVLELESGRLAIRDLDSTNGVIALAADGTETEVATAIATPLDNGSEIELGSFVIKIERV
jgi:hypothetical protein